MGVTQNSYIPRAWEVSDLKVSGATRPRPFSHFTYMTTHTSFRTASCGNWLILRPVFKILY